jgi:hypothetical protein
MFVREATEGAMSLFSGSTYWYTQTHTSATEVFTHDPTPLATHTAFTTRFLQQYGSPDLASTNVDIDLNVVVNLPLTCQAIHDYEFNAVDFDMKNFGWKVSGFVELLSNPDIAGLGVSSMLDKSDGCSTLTHQ